MIELGVPDAGLYLLIESIQASVSKPGQQSNYFFVRGFKLREARCLDCRG